MATSEGAEKWVWQKMDALREAVTKLHEENIRLRAELEALKKNPSVVMVHRDTGEAGEVVKGGLC